MATKAKLLLRELKGVRSDLTFSRNRCAQVEEENRRLRESIEKDIRHEEDDLVKFSALNAENMVSYLSVPLSLHHTILE